MRDVGGGGGQVLLSLIQSRFLDAAPHTTEFKVPVYRTKVAYVTSDVKCVMYSTELMIELSTCVI